MADVQHVAIEVRQTVGERPNEHIMNRYIYIYYIHTSISMYIVFCYIKVYIGINYMLVYILLQSYSARIVAYLPPKL